MLEVNKILLVTPCWDFSTDNREDPRLVIAQTFTEQGLEVSLVGPAETEKNTQLPDGIRIINFQSPRPRTKYSSVLARRILSPVTRAVGASQAELVHYLDARLAAFGIPPDLPTTGWLADTLGYESPLLPFSLRPNGPGWFGRWRQGRRARALQVGALTRLAGLAVPTPEIGQAAQAVQREGMPRVQVIPPISTDPIAHTKGLRQLWDSLAF